ncbi:MAG: SPOR domain-containing protein [Rhodobacteraceae bacterium]|nr:SPOR domain-containing protein [Paracoccaceae bacterium]
MGFKFMSVAILAAVFGATSLHAQSVARVGGPANPPPASFTGQQFIDSRGCVFLRAGYGGQTTWVPRVGRDRKAMCGQPQSGAARAAIQVATAEDMARPIAQAEVEAPVVAARPAAPAPKMVTAVQPVIPVAPMKPAVTTIYAAPPMATAPLVIAAPRQPVPYVEAAPRGTYEVASGNGLSNGQIGCYTSAPVAERVRTRNGGTAVVCTRGDGTMTGWRPPVYPRDAGVGAALTDPVMVANGGSVRSGVYGGGHSMVSEGQVYSRAESDTIPTPPKGYKLAWDDDRLNPNRGKGTASGWVAQDQVWTRKVPSRLVADQPVTRGKKKIVYVQSGSTVTVSTKGQPATAPVQKKVAAVAKGGAYIQVGTFGVASNADGAASRLKGIGLPVARAKITSGGKAMQIVMAGPFGSAADAQTALSMARSAGFGDAFIR